MLLAVLLARVAQPGLPLAQRQPGEPRQQAELGERYGDGWPPPLRKTDDDVPQSTHSTYDDPFALVFTRSSPKRLGFPQHSPSLPAAAIDKKSKQSIGKAHRGRNAFDKCGILLYMRTERTQSEQHKKMISTIPCYHSCHSVLRRKNKQDLHESTLGKQQPRTWHRC